MPLPMQKDLLQIGRGARLVNTARSLSRGTAAAQQKQKTMISWSPAPVDSYPPRAAHPNRSALNGLRPTHGFSPRISCASALPPESAVRTPCSGRSASGSFKSPGLERSGDLNDPDWVVRRMPIELGIMPKNYAGIMPRNVLGIMPNYAQNATLFRHYAENF